MNKKTLPILILFLIVILCVAILAKNLAAPAVAPAPAAPVVAIAAPVQNGPATTTVPSAAVTPPKLTVIAIKAPYGSIRTEVASTSAEQAQGLGDRPSLEADRGMLFPFLYPGDYGFWMKDMHFSLDMVWISSNKKVVGVLEDVSPETYPTVFYPPLAISYVLELNAGAAKEFGIATDTQLSF